MYSDRLSRRTAIKCGLAAIATPALCTAPAFGSSTSDSPNDRVNLGHIGVGVRGTQILNSIRNLPGVQSVAIADCFEQRRESAANQIRGEAYQDFRQMLDRKDIDGVIIATPDHWHVPLALMAADAGKDVYVEKPLGVCLEQDLLCKQAFSSNKRVFQYGTQQREAIHQQVGREIVRSGKLGELKAIEVKIPNGSRGGSTVEEPVPAGLDYDRWIGPAPMAPYTKDRCKASGGSYWCYDYSIGYLGGWGAHPLDILVWCYDGDMAGPFTVAGSGVVPTEELYNTVVDWNMTLQMSDGVKITITTGDNSTKFIGTEGKVELTRGTLRTSPQEWKPAELPSNNHNNSTAQHVANFAACIRSRENTHSHVDDAVRSDTISHLCDIAVRTGERITWDPTKQQITEGSKQATDMTSRPLREPWTLKV